MKAQMENGENPMTFKRRLAKEVVATFLSPAAAEEAEAHFTTVHQKHEIPEEVSEFVLTAPAKLVDVLVTSGLVSSKTDARRQIEQGGIKVDGEVVTDVLRMVSAPALLQKGKRHFIRLIP
jgi:tyrosyl-tRNA synthetase